jgi:hypothetical protein
MVNELLRLIPKESPAAPVRANDDVRIIRQEAIASRVVEQ